MSNFKSYLDRIKSTKLEYDLEQTFTYVFITNVDPHQRLVCELELCNGLCDVCELGVQDCDVGCLTYDAPVWFTVDNTIAEKIIDHYNGLLQRREQEGKF